MASLSSYDAVVAAQRRPGAERDDGALDLRELVRLATLAASSHNTQPWRFRLEERAVAILPDLSRRCPVVDPDDAHLFKSLGCAAENLVQAAAAQGHAASVRFDPGARAIRIDLERAPGVGGGPLFHAIPRRQCTRLPFDGTAVDTAARAALEAAASVAPGVRLLLVDDAPRRNAIVDAVRQGDLAQWSDPRFRRELIDWLRFNDTSALARGDGLAGRASGRKPVPDWLGRLAIRFAVTGASQARDDAALIRSAPLLAVFAAEGDDAAAWVETGRACQRFMLQATALDLRTAFLNQPIEVRRLREHLRGLLGIGAVPLLMLRVGHGPPAPFSLRRPLEEVVDEGLSPRSAS